MDLVVKEALTDRINTHELAWAAGLFDGEGYVGIQWQRKGNCNKGALIVQVDQTDDQVLRRFSNAVVGLGTLHGPYQQKGNRKPYWRWSVQNFEGSQAVIAMLWRFLSPIKKEQARNALTVYHAAQDLPDPRKK